MGGRYSELRIAPPETDSDRMKLSNRGRDSNEWIVGGGSWKMGPEGIRIGSIEVVEDKFTTTTRRWIDAVARLQDMHDIELQPDGTWLTEVNAAAERAREKMTEAEHGPKKGRIMRVRQSGDQEVMRTQKYGKYLFVTWVDVMGERHYEFRNFPKEYAAINHYEMAIDPRDDGSESMREYVVAGGNWRFSMRSEMFELDGRSGGFPTEPDSVVATSDAGGRPVVENGGGMDKAVEHLVALGFPARIEPKDEDDE